MNLFTHISISKILYEDLKNRMYLDKTAFIYGNIKPDLTSRCLSKPHTKENYFDTVVSCSEDLIKANISLEDFSIRLGEICHYVSDLFCKYHLNEEIYHKFKNHLVYEWKLHSVMLNNMSRRSLQPRIKVFRKNISSIINEMKKEYSLEPENMEKDLVYAISTTTMICESVFYYSVQQFGDVREEAVDAYQIMTIAGGK